MSASKKTNISAAWKVRFSSAVFAMLVFAPPAAYAQQADGLRGQVTEDEVNRNILRRPGLDERVNALDRGDDPAEDAPGFQPPDYEAVSEGAVTDETAERGSDNAQSIFDLNRDNPFADEPMSAERRARRTTRNRDLQNQTPRTVRQRIALERAERPGATEEADDEEILTGTVRADRIDALDEERNVAADPSSERTGAIEGFDREPEEDPYAPLGIRVGTFTLFPELEQGIAWSSNADSTSGGGEAILSETTLRLRAESDWSRHSAQIEAFGTFRQSLSGADVSEPSAGVDADLRLDLADGWAANAGVDYDLTQDSAASAVVVPGVVEQPLLHTLVGTLGVAREEGKLRLAATGRVERLIYGDADLGGGGTLSQRERNSTLATVTLRAGYEISPALVPFIEGEIGKRFYDVKTDSAGFSRSADRFAVRAGFELDLGEKLTGEIAAGWISEKPDDSRLAAVEGISALASLAWSPSRQTTVNLDAITTIETTTQPGASGSVLYDANLGVERQLRANLTGNLNAGVGFRDFVGSAGQDLLFDVEAGLTWWLNRNFGITGRGGYEIVESTVAGRDAETASVFLGVRLRR
ncbi:MAG: outer membrane beta-barrel protein [Rhizobiaceae bacterium]